MTFGDALREYRLSQGATQTEFAERLGITQPSYSALENSRDVKLSTVLKVSELLGVPPGRLMAFNQEQGK
jgi:transcriptional regulator with XRE-family HTH domain